MKELYLKAGAYYQQLLWWLGETFNRLVKLLSADFKAD